MAVVKEYVNMFSNEVSFKDIIEYLYNKSYNSCNAYGIAMICITNVYS